MGSILKEHFYDAASSTGYISWHLKTVQRKIYQGSAQPPNSPIDFSPGGPNCQRTVNVEGQLEGDACQEAMSLLNHTADNSLIFQKMRETFQHCQKLVNDPGRSVDILSSFPRFLDTKALVDQDFTLLFDKDTSSRLLQKWDLFFKPNVIKEAKRLTSTPELRRLVQSAESPPGRDLDEATTYDQEMASLLLLLHLLPPPPGGLKSPKMSACDAVERLVVFHKSILCSSITVWYAAATAKDKGRLQRVIRSAERVIGCNLPSLQDLFASRSLKRAKKIAADPSHPGQKLFVPLPSGRRLRSISHAAVWRSISATSRVGSRTSSLLGVRRARLTASTSPWISVSLEIKESPRVKETA
ncbi:uncharacterized protein LOC120811960 [Gasterosteus aculeatus]